MKLRSSLMIGALMLLFYYGSGQNFEGVITVHVSTHPENVTTVKIKGQKSVTEYQIDTTENIKIIKDAGADIQTILRRKDEMKYGYSTLLYAEETIAVDSIEIQKTVTCEITTERKLIGNYSCFKAVFHSDKAVAEAWLTKDLRFSLSKYVPTFLGDGTDPALLELRKRADYSGFVMDYKESPVSRGNETHIAITVEEKDIPLEDFATHGYIVLDKQGMERLLNESYSDPVKKKQWEEYRQLFGKKD